MPSNIANALPLRRSRQNAVATPRTIVMAVATMLVASEIQTGERSENMARDRLSHRSARWIEPRHIVAQPVEMRHE